MCVSVCVYCCRCFPISSWIQRKRILMCTMHSFWRWLVIVYLTFRNAWEQSLHMSCWKGKSPCASVLRLSFGFMITDNAALCHLKFSTVRKILLARPFHQRLWTHFPWPFQTVHLPATWAKTTQHLTTWKSRRTVQFTAHGAWFNWKFVKTLKTVCLQPDKIHVSAKCHEILIYNLWSTMRLGQRLFLQIKWLHFSPCNLQLALPENW